MSSSQRKHLEPFLKCTWCVCSRWKGMPF